jgi:hypothetical protein
MPYLLTVIKVDNYDKWKTEFDTDEGKAFRKSKGMKNYHLFRTENDPQTLVLLCKFDTLDIARNFLHSEELREISRQSGVIGESGSWVIQKIEQMPV